MLKFQRVTVRDWIKTTGLIDEAGVKEEQRKPRGDTGLTAMWHLAVRYSYRAGDLMLLGETLRMHDDDTF